MSVFVSCDKLDFKAQLMSTRYFASDLKKSDVLLSGEKKLSLPWEIIIVLC